MGYSRSSGRKGRRSWIDERTARMASSGTSSTRMGRCWSCGSLRARAEPRRAKQVADRRKLRRAGRGRALVVCCSGRDAVFSDVEVFVPGIASRPAFVEGTTYRVKGRWPLAHGTLCRVEWRPSCGTCEHDLQVAVPHGRPGESSCPRSEPTSNRASNLFCWTTGERHGVDSMVRT